jgi:DNA invertase Pin-like site-specific DNA recombinase
VLIAATAACFTQDELVAWLIERAAMTEGATLLTADGSFSPAPAPASGTWTRGAIDLARAYERVVLRSRTRAALAAKRSRGERIGAVPYGSRLAADGRHLEADDAEQAVIALVRGFASDGLSQRGIVARLAARGVVGRTGAPLGQTQIARLLVRA